LRYWESKRWIPRSEDSTPEQYEAALHRVRRLSEMLTPAGVDEVLAMMRAKGRQTKEGGTVIKILREWTGLPSDASDQDVEDWAKRLGSENERLKAETRRLRERAGHDAQTRRVDAALREAREARGERSAAGDAVDEAAARVREMIDKDRTKTLTEAAAYGRLWREDPSLFDRVTKARRERARREPAERRTEESRLLSEREEQERASRPAAAKFARLLAEARGAGLSISDAYGQVHRDNPTLAREMREEQEQDE